MDEVQFATLIARLEREQAQDPAKYRRKVLWLAAGGYAYIALVIIGAIALLLGALAIGKSHYVAAKMIFVVGAFIFLVVRAMWVRLDPPEGRAVTRQEAPELLAMIDKLQKDLHVSAHVDHVLVTEDINAAVVQVPRLGILGWYRNYLIIGLPLMKALTRKQFASVLAHELGHLAGGHGRLSNWIYRLRLGWARLAGALQQSESVASFVFRPFFTRYLPYFSAVSFPLARANEYEADRNAARLTSPTAAAAALTTVNVLGSFLESRYWPELHRQATNHARPQFSPFTDMGTALRTSVEERALRSWLAEAMARKTSVADTHPALTDRLKALGQPPRLAPPAPGEAADALLGPSLRAITEEFDRRWQDGIAPAWQRRHEQAQQDRKELAELDARAGNGTLSLDEKFQRALLTEDVGTGQEAALVQLQGILAEHPNHAPSCFSLGRRLLERDDARGVALIERAIERDPEASGPGAALLRDFHAKNGREAEAQRWHRIWSERQEVLYLDDMERSRVSSSDTLLPHGLKPDELNTVRQQIAGVPGVRAAWLVRKQVEQYPDHPLFVIGFKTTPWYLPLSAKKANAARDALVQSVSLPGSALVVCVEANNAVVGKRIRRIEGSRVL